MSRRKLKDGTTSFAGGLNLVDDETALRPDEVVDAENVSLIGRSGMASRCNGYQRTHSTALYSHTASYYQASMLRGWGDSSSSLKVLLMTPGYNKVANKSGTWYGVWTSSDTTIPMTWTFIGSGGSSPVLGTPQYGMETLRIGGSVYCIWLGTVTGNRVSVMNSTYSAFSSSWNIGGTLPVSCAESFNSRLFVGVGTSLYYSDLGLTGQEGQININGDGNINALKASADALYIFHNNSINVYTGWSAEDISVAAGLRGLSAQVGTYIRHVVMRATDECIYFAGSDGYFYRITPQGELQNLSINRLDRGASLLLVSVAEDPATGEIIWANTEATDYLDGADFYNDTGATMAYVYNYRLNAWTTREFSTAVGTASNRPHNFFTNAYENKLYSISTNYFVSKWTGDKFDVLSDGTGGGSITATLETKKFVFKDALATKMFDALYLEGTDTSMGALTTVVINGEAGSGSYFLKLDPPSARQGRPPWRYRIDQTSGSTLPGKRYRSMSAVLQWATPGTPEAFSAITLSAYDYGMR